MIQLFCNGVRLDLFAGTSFDFQKYNPLFAFDDLQAERSTSFSLPATATNNNVFGLAGRVWTRGQAMRKRMQAELYVSYIRKSGYLYITAFDGGQYKAVFVTGDLAPLFAAKDAGTLAELATDELIEWAAKNEKYAEEVSTEDDDFALVKYRTNEDILPSWSLPNVIQIAKGNARLDLSIILPNTHLGGDTDYFITNNKLNGVQSKAARFKSAGGEIVRLQVSNANTLFPREWDDSDLVGIETTQVGCYDRNTADAYRYNVQHYVARQDLKITFGKDFPTDLFLLSLPSPAYEGDYTTDAPTTFYGGYSFVVRGGKNEPITYYDVSGEPLAGRTAEVPMGARFILMKKETYQLYAQAFAAQLIQTEGYFFNSQTFSYDFAVTIEGTAKRGGLVRLSDQLPKWTIIDACKYYAAITGHLLDYHDKRLFFENLGDLQTWRVVSLDGKVIAGSANMERTFGKWGQANTIAFKSNEDVPTAEQQEVTYSLQNDSLTERVELMTIPMSEGAAYGADVYIAEERDDKGAITAGDAPTIAIAGAGTGEYMERVQITKNNRLAAIVDTSTRVEVSAKMTLAEFDTITSKTRIYFAGVMYVWVSLQWSKGQAKLTLQKI